MKACKKVYIPFIAFVLSGWGIGNNLSAENPFVCSPHFETKTKTAASPPFIINEIQAANIDCYLDPSFNFGGWVELYNPNPTQTFLRDLYVSDDIHHLKKFKVISDSHIMESKSYRVLWFGANLDTPSNVNFKLNPEGGIIYFCNENEEILLTHIYPPAIPRTSYARKKDGGEEWEYTAQPSPGTTNQNAVFAHERLAAPVVDTDACLFTQPFDFKVKIPAGATLKYTTDGTTPTPHNGKESADGLFHVEKTAVYRFCLLEDGKLPSAVVTRSFIYDTYHTDLPILSVVTDSKNLYDDHIGIFVRGDNGKPGNGQSTPCNWNMDWNRPVNVEYLNEERKMVINQETDMAIAGGWTRANMPKSFKIKAKKVYEGKKYLPYPVFKSKPYLKNKTWQVRNGGNDSDHRMKDATLQEIVHSSGLDVDGQACQPVLHFINGEFKGMLNIREPNNKDHAYANYGWDDTEIDQFQICGDSNYCQRCGTDEAFLKWYNLSARAKSDAVYEEICHIVDMDEYINYMAVEMFLGCGDYGHNNIKGFRPRVPDGKFRIILYDLDSAFGVSDPFTSFESRQMWTFHYDSAHDGNTREEIKFVTIFLNMLENEKFRKKFIDTYCLIAGSVFEPTRCEAIIDSMAQQRIAPLKLENKSPLGMAKSLKSGLNGRSQAMIQNMKKYSRLHMNTMKEVQLRLSSNIDRGILTVNDITVPTRKFSGSLFLPIMLKAETPSGYHFLGWKKRKQAARIPLLDWGSTWKYYDGGSLDGKSWQTGSESQNWKESPAPFGYNLKYPDIHNRCKTHLDYGADVTNKRPTYYFYKEISLPEALGTEDMFTLNLDVDDGAVVYVNGKEVSRYLLPEGNITYGTFATAYAGAEPNRDKVEIPGRLLKPGKNSIAVEIHNCNVGSSDIYFDAEFTLQRKRLDEGELVSQDKQYELVTTDDCELIACYEPLSDEEQSELLPPVVINEISADNSIFVNEYFKKNDWIELYNRTNDTIDIAGMYLSDHRINPHKYQIAEGMNKAATQIKPHDYLILWADGLVPVSQLHTNFKLAREGGEVLLTAADDAWADTLVYEAHNEKYSVGRYPDGGEQLYVMTMPSIASANVLNSYSEMFEEPDYPVGIATVTPEATALRVKYQQRQLYVYSEPREPISLYLYNIGGQCVMEQHSDMESGHATINLSGLRRGTYIAKVDDASGRQCRIKFVITTEW